MSEDPTPGADDCGAVTDTDANRWLDEHGDALYRYARSRVGSRDLAEDLVQETLLAALQARDDFQGRSSVGTWLLAILRRKVVDHYRKAETRAVLAGDLVSPDPSREFDDEGHWLDPPAPWRTPPEHLEAREFLEVLNGCLGGLPASLARAFVLRELEDLEPEELCRVLSLTPGNLRVRLHRARLLLRACLERRWFHESPARPTRHS
jgi:RNA polymerase sigma-70 factor (ECF subfamily)